MARYRKVDVRLWIDERFQSLSAIPPCGQGLWLYLITNPDTTNIPGLYRAGEAAMAEALGWPLKAFRKAFVEAFVEGMAKADWRHRVVWIPKAIKYNKPESPNVVRAWRGPWDEIPECALKDEAYRELKAFAEGLGEGFGKAFAEACGKPSGKAMPNQEQEQEQEPEKKPAAPAASIPPWALESSELLIELLGPVPGAVIPQKARNSWAKEIAKLAREAPELASLENPQQHIEGAIRWALGPKNLGERYEVVIRSGRSLREKWPKLRAAANRVESTRVPSQTEFADKIMARMEASRG